METRHINKIIKVGKAPDTLARIPEMLDTPPSLWFYLFDMRYFHYGDASFFDYKKCRGTEGEILIMMTKK